MKKKKVDLKARKGALGLLSDEMRKMKKEDGKEGFKKKLQTVTVKAKDKEGLEKGLSMAQKIMKGKEEMMAAKDGGIKGDKYACGGKKYEDGGVKEGSDYDELKEEEKKYKKKMYKKMK